MLDPIVRSTPLCAGPIFSPGSEPLLSEQIPETKTTVWTDAVHVCEVRYREFTPDGLLRHAAFLRLRTDKRPHECERQGWAASTNLVSSVSPEERIGDDDAWSEGDAKGRVVRERAHVDATALHEPPPPPPRAAVEKKIAFSNLNKVFWPAEKY